MASVLNG